MAHMRIEVIKVAGRYRRDLGDIEALAKSITAVGLINPITVTSDGQLIAGQRRLEACRLLGDDLIPVMIADDLEAAVARLIAERDENTERKEMTISERVALAKALEALETPRAAQRQHEARVRAGKIRQGTLDPASVSPETDAGRASEIAGRAVGMSPTTYYKASKVVDAASDPAADADARQVASAALADMDATGNVAGNFEKVQKVRDARLGQIQRTVIADLKKQRHALNGAVASLCGISIGLKRIGDLHPDITNEEAAQWVGDLSETRRVIEQIIKRLKERTNA